VRSLVDVVGYVNLGIFTLVALAAFRQWRAGRGRAGLWAALTFGALAAVADIGPLLPNDPEGGAALFALRLLLATLVLFPYLLYRFTTAFEPPTRRLERFLGLMTVGVLAWTFVVPSIPGEDESWPLSFVLYVVAFFIHWTVLSIVVAVRLWRAGRGQPNVARRRMQLLAFAATAITAALFLSLGGDDASVAALVSALLATVSGIAFLVGLAPPRSLRMFWRLSEQDRVQRAVTGLMGATTEEEVAQQVLPPMARLVGARAAALQDADGRWVGAYRASDEMLVTIGAADSEDTPPDVLRLPIPTGSLVVWTSPYAPYFGTEELRLLETLGALTGLALDRSRLFAHERQTREALERADEIKTNFVALAAHELRTPVASIKGIVDTLHARAHQLAPEQTDELQETLRQQTERIGVLVEQLLDLSRLDAEAVPIRPQPLAVRQRVEELVSAAAGARKHEVQIEVAPDLAALVDPAAFDRIVSNLIVNALRYGEAPVTVSAERSDRHFRLAVEDSGPGVPPEFVPNLFERFTRGEQTRSRTGGSGLGLAIARSYAQAHRGDLIYQRGDPRGARFNLVLPAE
jgi:signal transduction histidine kinase